MRTMRKVHKGLLVGGITLAVLVPAGIVVADQGDNGNGNRQGRNGTMTHDCTGDQTADQIRARDGTGPEHADNVTATSLAGAGERHQSGPMDGTGPQADRPLDGTGNQWGNGR
ncbi:MAG: hypothetical protein Q8M22_04505 [Actinomycetota bacterium]|nr:hypothetical protein [Actinomycetota bacterium]